MSSKVNSQKPQTDFFFFSLKVSYIMVLQEGALVDLILGKRRSLSR